MGGLVLQNVGVVLKVKAVFRQILASAAAASDERQKLCLAQKAMQPSADQIRSRVVKSCLVVL